MSLLRWYERVFEVGLNQSGIPCQGSTFEVVFFAFITSRLIEVEKKKKKLLTFAGRGVTDIRVI